MNELVAWGHYALGNGETAQAFLARSRPLLPELPYSEELRLAYDHQACAAAEYDKDLSARREWCERLEAIAKQAGDVAGVGNALKVLGQGLILYGGDPGGAIPVLQRSRNEWARIGDAKEQGACRLFTAWSLLALGGLAEAEEEARVAAEELESAGRKHYAFLARWQGGTAALCRGDWRNALDAFEEALRLDRELGRKGGWPIYHMGRTFLAMGKREEAIEQLHRAMDLGFGGWSMLSALEAAADASDRFREFVESLREQERNRGDGIRVQWFLEPAEPRWELPTVALPDGALGGWSWEDPMGDCDLEMEGGITIRAANGRTLEHANVTAPRLARPIEGDFGIQVVCLTASTDRPGIGGLLLWKDRRDYLRLERGMLDAREVAFLGCIGDRGCLIGRGRLTAERVMLRLERVGDEVRGLCSADGEDWFRVGSVAFPAEDPVQVGLHAIGEIDRVVYNGAYPDGTAIRFGV
jgi:tetratricopeptide (TPR) repeat protein